MEKVRGFEVVQGVDKRDVILPERATTGSAGYDFRAIDEVIIPSVWQIFLKSLVVKLKSKFAQKELKVEMKAHSTKELLVKPRLVNTGVKAYMKEDEVLLLYNRSSTAIQKLLLMGNGVGVIDSDYYENENNDGEIMFAYMNFGFTTKVIKKGERIGQGIFKKFLKTDNDNSKGIRKGGIGSTS